MGAIRISIFMYGLLILFACGPAESPNKMVPTPEVPAKPVVIAESFAYPVGKTGYETEKKDRDDWYVALEFRENDHLGEDWNMNTGGNTDCGEPVFAIGNGVITYAKDAGAGWGNVVIIEHTLPSGEKVESLYGHLLEILVKSGEVTKRQQIGKVGNANGLYLCHLHLEIRTSDCPMWDRPGGGYSSESKGWIDPSDFIDSHR